jgi:hypothetical protein
MIEIQKSRIHDIVHGGFIALNSLIPNPIKSSIRKSIRDYVSGGGTQDNQAVDVGKAVNILDPSNYKQQAFQLQNKINQLGNILFIILFYDQLNSNKGILITTKTQI